MNAYHRTCFIALLACAAAVAAGCSRGRDTDTIRLGYLQSDLHHLPAFVALEKRYFSDEGLHVTVGGIFRAGPEQMSAFAAGELDIGYVGLAPAATAALNGVVNISILAQVNIEGSAIVCRPGTASSLQNLRGTTVAIPGHATMQDCLMQKGLRRAGLGPDALRIMVLKPPEMLQAMTSGNIDCFIAWEPYPAQAVAGGSGEIVERSRTLWQDHPCCVLIAQSSFTRTRPDAAEKILRAHERACRFIAEHPEDAIEIGMRYTGMPRATVEQALAHMQFNPDIDTGMVQDFVAFLSELRYLSPARDKSRRLEFFTHD